MAAEAALSNVIILTSIFEYLRNIPYYLSTDVSVWSGNSLLGLEKRRENVTNALCVNKTWAEYGTCVVWKEARCGQFMQLRPERRYYYARKIRQIAIYRSLTQEQVDMFKATLLTGLTDLNLYAEKVADFRNVMDVLGVGMNNLRRLHLHGPVAQTAEAGEEICEIIKVSRFTCLSRSFLQKSANPNFWIEMAMARSKDSIEEHQ